VNQQLVVSGGLDDLRSPHLRFLEEASKLGDVTILLWPDEMLHRQTGEPPKFPLAERLYLLNAVRYVMRVIPLPAPMDFTTLPRLDEFQPQVWVDEENETNAARYAYCRRHGLEYRVLPASRMLGFPEPPPMPSAPGRKKVVATGCYDWFHSGHVRFFEEVSAYGDNTERPSGFATPSSASGRTGAHSASRKRGTGMRAPSPILPGDHRNAQPAYRAPA